MLQRINDEEMIREKEKQELNAIMVQLLEEEARIKERINEIILKKKEAALDRQQRKNKK